MEYDEFAFFDNYHHTGISRKRYEIGPQLAYCEHFR